MRDDAFAQAAISCREIEPQSVGSHGVRREDAGSGQVRTRPLRTLRAKAILALSAMVVYVAVFALYVAHDRAKLLHIVQQQEDVYRSQKAFIEVNVAITHSIQELQYVSAAFDTVDIGNVSLDLATVEAALPQLKANNPDLSIPIARFERSAAALREDWSRDRVNALRNSEETLNEEIEMREERLAERHIFLGERYREANRTVFIAWVVSSMVGVALFGSIVTVFFTRLAKDLKTLESRAVAVVGGYRGPALEIRRSDEVGGLMHAVNNMQSVLRKWEQQQELSREQRFHQEKMAAVGSLAAAVAHEVTNPIAAIAGIARHMLDAPATRTVEEPYRAQAQLILSHTERIASIMRQIGDVASYRSPTPKLLDVNAHVLATCNFVAYDNRFHGISLATDLANGLPAVRAVADHLTQVLMNLLINAADAMEQVRDRKPVITVSTRLEPGYVVLAIRDNGAGMAPEVLEQAFREFFTTKPADKGRGIGLFLCRMIIEEIGGRVGLESRLGFGTTASVFLPTPGGAKTAG